MMDTKNRLRIALLIVLALTAGSACDALVSEPEQVFEDEYDDHWPVLSPSGQYLCFISDRDGTEYPEFEYDICIYDFETGEIKQLTNNPNEFSFDYHPHWSMDCDTVFFYRMHMTETSSTAYLCSVSVNGTEDDVEYLVEKSSELDVFEDGSAIIMIRDFDYLSHISTYNIDTGEVNDVSLERKLYSYDIALTPNGDRLYISLYDDGDYYGSNIIIYEISNSEFTPFDYENYVVKRIDFSPDGKYCILTSEDDNIYKISINGGTSEALDFDPDGTEVEWADDGYMYYTHEEREYGIRSYSIWRYDY